MVWFCNSCRKKPPSCAGLRLNEQVIEKKSTRVHAMNVAETQTLPSPLKRPSLTRQDSESIEKQNFRIPKESHSMPRSGIDSLSFLFYCFQVFRVIRVATRLGTIQVCAKQNDHLLLASWTLELRACQSKRAIQSTLEPIIQILEWIIIHMICR